MRSIESKFVELLSKLQMCMLLFVIVKLFTFKLALFGLQYIPSTLELKIDFYFGIVLIAVSLASSTLELITSEHDKL